MITCSRCRISKPAEDFGNRASKKNGKDSQCKECCKIWLAANLDKVNDWRRERYQLNAEKEKEAKRRCYLANPELYKARTRAWERANPERCREKSRKHRSKEVNREAARIRGMAYTAKNKEKIAAQHRLYRKSNLHIAVRAAHRRRALLAGAVFEKISIRDVAAKDGWNCYICGITTDPMEKPTAPNKATLDHVIPLSRGGSHTFENLRCACRECNCTKGAHHTPQKTLEMVLHKREAIQKHQ